jgi:hypothetical protein
MTNVKRESKEIARKEDAVRPTLTQKRKTCRLKGCFAFLIS